MAKLTRSTYEVHPVLPIKNVDEYSHELLVTKSINLGGVTGRVVVWYDSNIGADMIVSGASYASAFFEAFPGGFIDADVAESYEEAFRLMHESTLKEYGASVISEAKLLDSLKSTFSLSDARLAECIGCKRSTVNSRVAMLKLHPVVKKYVNEGALDKQHAKYLLAAKFDLQPKLAKKAVLLGLSSRALYREIHPEYKDSEGFILRRGESASQVKKSPDITRFERVISERMGLPTTYSPSLDKKAHGDLSFEFSSYDEFTRLLDLVTKKGGAHLKIKGAITFDNLSVGSMDDLLSAFLKSDE
jgi:hypothetical protein